MPRKGRVDAAILNALVAWVETDQYGQGILMDLVIDRACPLCEGTTCCPKGCPMAVCELDYEKKVWRRERPIREYEYQLGGDGDREQVVRGRECDACTIYGRCMSCSQGRERRRADKTGAAYLIDSLPLYSVPGYGLTDPIRISAARVAKEIELRHDPQLDLLGAAA